MVDTPPGTTGTTGIPTNVSPNPHAVTEWGEITAAVKDADQSLSSVSDTAGTANQVFDKMNNYLNSLGGYFSSLSGMTDKQAANFGLVTTSIIGATKAFEALGSGVDTSRLLTFSGQFKDLFQIISAGPGTQIAGKAIETIVSKMVNLGATTKQVGAVMGDLKKGVVDSAAAFFTSADNVVRLQNSFMQMTIQGTGAKALFDGIPGVLAGVGDNFQNISEVTSKYSDVLARSTTFLGGNREEAAQYMAQINRMPGGLKALLGPTDGVLQGTDLLVDSMQLAIGAGRKQEEVFNDMSKAMTEYSTSGTDALRFSARMTEVADALGAQVHDVQGALFESADAFKMFVSNGADATKMTQGMADAMKNYVGQLTSVGVPAQNAIGMFKQYTSVMSSMTLGQQAFVSSMSGGPGGLRGAFQMDAAIKSGKFEEVRQQVESTIKKMTGPIVSLDEAQKSEGAAAQYTRQIQLLQSGPLGAMAKTRPEAEALLQAMKEGKKLPAGGGKDVNQSMLDTMTHGEKWQKGTYTKAAEMAASLKNMENKAGQANLRTARGLTAADGMMGGGGGGTGAGITAGQERLRSHLAAATSMQSDVMKDAGQSVSSFASDVEDGIKSFREMMGGNAPQQPGKSEYATAGKQVGHAITTGKHETAGRQVGHAITAGRHETEAGGRDTHAAATAGQLSKAGQHPVPVTLAPGSTIQVKFTGSCPHCGRAVDTTEAAKTISPQSNLGAGF